MPQPKAKKNGATTEVISGYIPKQQYRWLEFREEGDETGDETLQVKVRAHLTGEEVAELSDQHEAVSDAVKAGREAEATEGKKPLTYHERMRPYYEVYALYVVDWNIVDVADDGTLIKVEPPATGGADQFAYLPDNHFSGLATHLLQQANQPVRPKPLKPSVSTPVPLNAVSTDSA